MAVEVGSTHIPGSHEALSSGAETAPEAVSPPPGNPRFPYLDSLRALAAGLVLVFHADLATGHSSRTLRDLSQLGVAIFFVLSGFLLYRPFVRSRMAGEGLPSMWHYARRRVLRIVPAYWLALTFAIIVAGATSTAARHVPVYYLLLQDYSNGARYNGLGVAWTLSIEATYYVLLPALAALAVLLARRVPASRWRLPPEALIIAGLGVITLNADRQTSYYAVLLLLVLPIPLVVRLPTSRWRVPPEALIPAGIVAIIAELDRLRSAPPASTAIILNYADWFAVGMLLALLSIRLGQRALPGWAAVGLWVAAALVFDGETHIHGLYLQHVLWIMSAAMIVATAVFPARRGPVRAILGCRVMLWLGLVSYGIYLWHVPLMSVIEKFHHFGLLPLSIMSAVLAVGVAAVSYYLLEARLMRLKYGRGRADRVLKATSLIPKDDARTRAHPTGV